MARSINQREQQRKIHEIGDWLGPGSLNFFGLQFAGKDTQAERLAKPLNATVLKGGDILRKSIIPDHVREIMDSGKLIPTPEYVNIVLPYLSNQDFANRPMFLSAVGRMKGEEAGVLSATFAAGHPVKAVPYLEITVEESFTRLATTPERGRNDDNPVSLQKRHEEFEALTKPVLATYEAAGLLVPIDGMQAEALVFDSMVHLLRERALAA